MRRPTLFSVILFAGFCCLNGGLRAEGPRGAESSGELFPHVRPVYVSPAAASSSDIVAPLATPDDEKTFHGTYDGILQEAHGRPVDPDDLAAVEQMDDDRPGDAGGGEEHPGIQEHAK